jgi:hypothetical protein
MNPIRNWIETILRVSREQAECNELNRKILQRVFIFGIEIGRGKRLTPKERVRLEKTLITAEAFMAIAEKCPPDKSVDRIIDDCVVDWPKHQPKLKKLLERVMEHSLDEVDPGPAIWPEIREWIAGQFLAVSRAYPEQLPASEIPAILDRLDHPLDRA